MTTFALDALLRVTVVVLVAAAADRALRRRASAAARHALWTAALALVLLLPLAAAAMPHWTIAIPVAHLSNVQATAPAATTETRAAEVGAVRSATVAVPPLTSAGAASTTAVSATRSIDWLALALIVYAVGALALLVRLAVAQTAVRRLTRAAHPLPETGWQLSLRQAAERLAIRRPIGLLQSDSDMMPLTCGVRYPRVIVPAAAASWSPDRVDAVLLHELAHVARLDCLTQAMAAVACAIYWPHPGVWYGARRMRIEREFACDDLVLGAGTRARDYASHLLEIAHTFRAAPVPATALGMARARQLETRLLAVMDAARNRAALKRGAAVLASALALVLLVPIASLRAALVPQGTLPRPELLALSGPAVSPPAAPAAPQQPSAAQGNGSGIGSAVVAEQFSGVWEMRLRSDRSVVEVTMRTLHSSHGRDMPLARFQGLTVDAMADSSSVVQFTSARDAGTFDFAGVCHNGLCGGTYSFAPNAAFASQLAARGIGKPTEEEQYQLAVADVGVEYLDGLKAAGYAVPDVHTLVRAAQHGVTLDYVRGMGAFGYKPGTLEALIRMRDHGVDPTFVKGLADQGFTNIPADDIVRLRDHGVDPVFVKGMRGAGYGSASLADLVRARDHGADPAFAAGLVALGYKDLPLDALIRARDHGVDPQFVKGMQGLGSLSIADLTKARDHGVDPAYVREMAALGYRDVPLASLIRMRDHGVDPAFVKLLQEHGAGHLDVDELIQRRDHGYTGR